MVKFQVRALHDDIAGMERQLTRERATLTVLSAEWSYLNRPQRLQALMEAHAHPSFVAPVQLADVNDLPHVYALAAGDVPAPDRQPVQLAAAPAAKPTLAALHTQHASYTQLEGQVTTSSLKLGSDE